MSSAGTGPPRPPAAEVPELAGLAGVLRPALELYLDLHRHPELSGAERRTAGAFADRLERAGCHVLRGIGGHGVVGVLRSGPGPTVLLRAELDALPVAERTGLPYASEQVERDARRPVGAGDARLRARRPPRLLRRGGGAARPADRTAGAAPLLVVGQPAEETLSGARAMLADRSLRPGRPAGRRAGPAHRAAAGRDGRARHRGGAGRQQHAAADGARVGRARRGAAPRGQPDRGGRRGGAPAARAGRPVRRAVRLGRLPCTPASGATSSRTAPRWRSACAASPRRR